MTSARGALLPTLLFAIVVAAVSGVLPLWLDEILQLTETRGTSTTEMLARLPRNSGAAPLGYLTQRASLRITGYSVRSARLPAGLFGVATVFVAGLLAAEIGIRYPWLAATLFAAFPQTLRYADESRIYSQALFLSALATLIYVRLAKRATPRLAAAYWLALTGTMYTHPFSACVGLAHVAWAAWRREFRTAAYGCAALALSALAFLPWYLWSKEAWAAGIAREGFHFSASFKTPLTIFREVAGTGYWGSALLLALCSFAIVTKRPPPRPEPSDFADRRAYGQHLCGRRICRLLRGRAAVHVDAAGDSHPRGGGDRAAPARRGCAPGVVWPRLHPPERDVLHRATRELGGCGGRRRGSSQRRRLFSCRSGR